MNDDSRQTYTEDQLQEQLSLIREKFQWLGDYL